MPALLKCPGSHADCNHADWEEVHAAQVCSFPAWAEVPGLLAPALCPAISPPRMLPLNILPPASVPPCPAPGCGDHVQQPGHAARRSWHGNEAGQSGPQSPWQTAPKQCSCLRSSPPLGPARVQVRFTFLLQLPAHPPNAPAAHVQNDAFPFTWGLALLARESAEGGEVSFYQNGC